MKPQRTIDSNAVFHLAGGTEDNDLWVEGTLDSADRKVICSVWVPTRAERQQIADGANIELVIWGEGVPPLAMHTTTVQLGQGPGGHVNGEIVEP